MKKKLPLLCLIIFSKLSFSQDVILFRNGNEKTVKVLEVGQSEIKYKKNDSASVLHTIPKTDVFMIKYKDGSKDVFKLEQQENELADDTKSNRPIKIINFKKKGFINLTELNSSYGVQKITYNTSYATYLVKNKDYSVGFKTVNGYQFNDHFILGIGIGVEQNRCATIFPLSLDFRASILKGAIRPNFNLNVSYAFIVNENNNKVGALYTEYDSVSSLKIGSYGCYSRLSNEIGEFFVAPSLGIKKYISSNTTLYFDVGYKIETQHYSVYKQTKYPPFDYSVFYKTGVTYFHFLTLNIGASF